LKQKVLPKLAPRATLGELKIRNETQNSCYLAEYFIISIIIIIMLLREFSITTLKKGLKDFHGNNLYV